METSLQRSYLIPFNLIPFLTDEEIWSALGVEVIEDCDILEVTSDDE